MPELTSLSESERDQALERFRTLQPHLEQGRPLRQVASEAGIPYRTAQRWLASYRRFGLSALARKAREDRGSRRRLSPKMREVVESLALQKPPVPITALYRQVREIALGHGERAPSYRVVYDVVRRLPADLMTLAHEGTKAYSDAFELVHRREADRSNAIWQADHTLLDIELLNPGAAGAPRVAKPWLTVVLDDYRTPEHFDL